jgi:hypothetical protein
MRIRERGPPGLAWRSTNALTQEQTMTALAKQIAEKTELKSFRTPDEIREFPRGRLGLMKIGGATIGRAIFEPGWRWATSVQPIAKTSSCEAPHFQYHMRRGWGLAWSYGFTSLSLLCAFVRVPAGAFFFDFL